MLRNNKGQRLGARRINLTSMVLPDNVALSLCFQ